MTSYTVDWTKDAENALTLSWIQTSDPAVTAASDQIDRLLTCDPLGHGQLVHEGLYKLTEPPLSVTTASPRQAEPSAIATADALYDK